MDATSLEAFGAIEPAALGRLRSDLRGEVITPVDSAYEVARRVWNGMIDRRPALIVRAATPDDVRRTIDFARTRGLPLAVRGGGHGVAGTGTVENGVILDLGVLNRVEVDSDKGLVRVGGGATLGDVDRACVPFGLVVPAGVVSGTGIGGLTLGGGVGWLTRRHGLTLDNLVSAEVVVAGGERVVADESANPDLFWGLRGGGGNFGVVTELTFRAQSLRPAVLAGYLIFEPRHWVEALAAYGRWTDDAPDDITTITTFMVPPPDWKLGDLPRMFLGLAWAGPDPVGGERQIARLRAACPPHDSTVHLTPWLEVQSAFDAALPPGVRAYWRNVWFDDLNTAVDTIVEHCATLGWVGVAADLHHMGGAFGRIDEDRTAFPSRSASFWLNIYGFWAHPGDDVRGTGWVKSLAEAMQPVAVGGQYVNFLGADEARAERKALAIYGPAKLERLRAVKRRYDPENLFRINHNIAPRRDRDLGLHAPRFRPVHRR